MIFFVVGRWRSLILNLPFLVHPAWCPWHLFCWEMVGCMGWDFPVAICWTGSQWCQNSLRVLAPFLTYHLCHEHHDVELMGLSPKELGITMRSKVFEDFCDQPHDEEVIKVHPWLAGDMAGLMVVDNNWSSAPMWLLVVFFFFNQVAQSPLIYTH